MLEPIDLMILEVIAVPELGAASFHAVGGFQPIVTEIAVAGFDEVCRFRFKVTGLVRVQTRPACLAAQQPPSQQIVYGRIWQ